MAYAAVSDLKARSGRLSAAWSATSVPSDPTDLSAFLADAAAKIDAALSAYTETTPVTGTAALALTALNANMAALDALRATFPSGSGPNEAEALINSLQEITYGANGEGGEYGALVRGLHPVVILLRQASGAPTATAFWLDEPDYGEFASPDDVLNVNPQMLPLFSRLSKF